MRPDEAMTRWRRSRVGAGALMIAIAACAAAFAASQALALPARGELRISPLSIHMTHGHDLVVRGTAAMSDAGHTIVPSREIAVLGGQAIQVRGRLVPAHAGRKVNLQAQHGGRWQTLATARTGGAGRFVLRYVAAEAGQPRIRVRFAGDRLNGRSAASAGQITVYREVGASWYNDGGNTACGFHARYGVANRTLPCGTTVALRYNGRSVTATVDDRGPFVGGRDWDLNQNTAAALGFGGVGTVWSSQ
jgi:rare lipoprotein A